MFCVESGAANFLGHIGNLQAQRPGHDITMSLGRGVDLITPAQGDPEDSSFPKLGCFWQGPKRELGKGVCCQALAGKKNGPLTAPPQTRGLQYHVVGENGVTLSASFPQLPCSPWVASGSLFLWNMLEVLGSRGSGPKWPLGTLL